MDLSFPPDAPFKIRPPGIDIYRLCELIFSKGRGCLINKKALQRAYRQIPIIPMLTVVVRSA